jgi:alcohol dehydrogenase (NADP+)
MLDTKGYAAYDHTSPLRPFAFQRRDPGERDVLIDILYCGVCHSDLHQVRNEWQTSAYPMVPGHEIVGRVSAVGAKVTRFKAGDLAGVGCMVGSCGACRNCREGLEQYCEKGFIGTYNGLEKDGKTPTQGGYSARIVVDEDFVLRIHEGQSLPGVAPLLCAGITTFSPIRHFDVGPGARLGVLGLGGLGHMAVKFGRAAGAEVTVLSTSPKKREDAARLRADDFLLTTDDKALAAAANRFDFIIDTVSAPHDLTTFARLLRRDGKLILLGAPDKPATLPAFSLIFGRRSVAGSLIGGIRETQDMLDLCAKKNIESDVEVIAIQQIDDAYDRMLRGDVRYRFVIDMASLG